VLNVSFPLTPTLSLREREHLRLLYYLLAALD
jgi:hypothetical protein